MTENVSHEHRPSYEPNETENETDFDYGLRAFDALTNAVGEAITLLEKVTKRQEQIIQKQDEIWTAMQAINKDKSKP